MVPKFLFRPATENDINFLWALRQQTMKPYIRNSYGWNDNEEYEYAKESLMCTRIILINNNDVGIVKIIEFADHFVLKQIQVLPDWSNHGIGSQVIKDLITKASQNKKSVRLHVLKNNPAKNLYTRLGFSVVNESDYHVIMEHAATAEA